MTTEQLLAPRFKCIAEDTSGNWTLGEIIQFEPIHPYSGLSAEIDNVGVVAPQYFEKYPHLFRPMSWWEERKVEDMPKYLKHKDTIRLVNGYKELNGIAHVACVASLVQGEEDVLFTLGYHKLYPATLSEYTAFKTKEK